MARGRMISKSLGASKRFTDLQTHAGKLGEFAAALFCLVVSNCDDFGRLEGDAASVKWRCWPASLRSEHDFAVALKAMHEARLIIWYEVADRHIVEVVQFSEHQSGLHKRTRSKFPDPPGRVSDAAVAAGEPEVVGKTLLEVFTEQDRARARNFIEHYSVLYAKHRKQPYLSSYLQQQKDLEAATTLCRHYSDDELERITVQFLKARASHPMMKILKGTGQRTLPMLRTLSGDIASKLDIQGDAS